MSLQSWIRSLFKASPQQSVHKVLSILPESISANEILFCFKDSRKTLVCAEGALPKTLAAGEKCAVLSTRPLDVSIETNNCTYDLKIVAEPDDTMAASLERHSVIDDTLLASFCRNALEAVLPSLAKPPSLERLRARVSIELMGTGFRCIELKERTTAEEQLSESSTDTEFLETRLSELDGAARSLGWDPGLLPVARAERSESRDEFVLRMRNTIADMERRLGEYRADLADARSIEARLGLPSVVDGAARPAPRPIDPVDVENITRPFTALVIRRSDIDDKLRRYIADLLDAAIAAADTYRNQNLARDLRLNGRAMEYIDSLRHCQAQVGALPVLRHDFKYTRPGSSEVRRRVNAIKNAAAAAAGVHGATVFLCQQPLDEKQIGQAMQEAEAAALVLLQSLKAAAKAPDVKK